MANAITHMGNNSPFGPIRAHGLLGLRQFWCYTSRAFLSVPDQISWIDRLHLSLSSGHWGIPVVALFSLSAAMTRQNLLLAHPSLKHCLAHWGTQGTSGLPARKARCKQEGGCKKSLWPVLINLRIMNSTLAPQSTPRSTGKGCFGRIRECMSACISAGFFSLYASVNVFSAGCLFD